MKTAFRLDLMRWSSSSSRRSHVKSAGDNRKARRRSRSISRHRHWGPKSTSTTPISWLLDGSCLIMETQLVWLLSFKKPANQIHRLIVGTITATRRWPHQHFDRRWWWNEGPHRRSECADRPICKFTRSALMNREQSKPSLSYLSAKDWSNSP